MLWLFLNTQCFFLIKCLKIWDIYLSMFSYNWQNWSIVVFQLFFIFLKDMCISPCSKAWWKPRWFHWTICTYVHNVARYIRVTLNILGGDIRIVEKPCLYLIYGFAFQFPLFRVLWSKMHLTTLEITLNSNNARVIFMFQNCGWLLYFKIVLKVWSSIMCTKDSYLEYFKTSRFLAVLEKNLFRTFVVSNSGPILPLTGSPFSNNLL